MGEAIERASKLDAERHRVTVLFADLEDSTGVARAHDPEGAAAVIEPAIRAMIDAVEAHGGVAADRGDGVMATFGSPSVCEDHGIRACLAALAIRERVRVLNGGTLSLRIGINFGDVVIGQTRIGRIKVPQVNGLTVHVAARLQQTAPRNAICLSAAVQAQVRGFVLTEPLPPVALRGFDAPIERVGLIGVDPSADRWGVRAADGLVDLVSREDELALLAAALDATCDGGLAAEPARASGCLVHVVGSAGVGKSRLLHEFLTSPGCADRCVVRLAGDPHRRASPFHPIATWLRTLADLRQGDADPVATEKVRRLLPSGPGREAAIDFVILSRLLGVARIPGAGPRAPDGWTPTATDAAEVVAAVIRARAKDRGIVLACDDFDCFDGASRELIAALVELMASDAMLLVTTSRARVRLGARKPWRIIRLEPLGEAETRELLARLDSGLAARPAILSAIVGKTGGNPLFVEEMVAMLARTARETGGEAKTGARDDALGAIPNRVETLIEDRLRRLSRAQRHLVDLCAVIGRDIPVRLLARLAGTTVEELYPRLLKLQADDVLTETRRYPDPRFSFRHALIRDVAYDKLLVRHRPEWHARVVDALETEAAAGGGRPLDALAYHARHARLGVRAIAYLRESAAAAIEKSAYQSAFDDVGEALKLARAMPDDDARASLLLDMVLEQNVVFGAAGRYQDIAALLDEAEGLAARLGDRANQARLAAYRVHVLAITGDLPAAIDLGRRACDLAAGTCDAGLRLLAAHNLAQAHFNRGDLADAEAVLAPLATEPELGAVGRPGTIGSLAVLLHGTRAMAAAFRGDEEVARHAAAVAERASGETGRAYDAAFAAFVAGVADLHRDDPERAEQRFRHGLTIAMEHGIEQLAPPLQTGLGHALARTSDPRAAAWLELGYESAGERRRMMIRSWAAGGLGQVRAAAGQRSSGLRLADEAVDIATRHGFRAYRVLALRARAAVLLSRKQWTAEADDTLRRAEAEAVQLGMPARSVDRPYDRLSDRAPATSSRGQKPSRRSNA